MKHVLMVGLILLLALNVSAVSYGAEPAGRGTEPATTVKQAPVVKQAPAAKPVKAKAGSADADMSQNVVSRHPIGDKAERGTKNILFGWTEIPKRVVDITKETRNPIWGVVAGVFQGTGRAFARTASGVSDVVTAPIRPNDKPFIQEDMDIK